MYKMYIFFTKIRKNISQSYLICRTCAKKCRKKIAQKKYPLRFEEHPKTNFVF